MYHYNPEGARWNKEQTEVLLENFHQGKNIHEITNAVNQKIKDSRPGAIKTVRTYDSVAYKLKNLGLITEQQLSDTLKAKRVMVQFHRLNNYDDIKKEVFARDKNKCIICGGNDWLQLAHVVPFRETFAKEERELISLCKKCHKIFDELNEFETKKIFDYMCKIYPNYEKEYKMTYRYNPVTNKDLAEIKRIS